MTEFNCRTIKDFKGRMVCISYGVMNKNRMEEINHVTGEITASTKYHILFNCGKSGHEISLKYTQIKAINEPELVKK